MKLIEALKKTKDLKRKAEDIRGRIKQYSAYLDIETPAYENQKDKIREWLQAHSDIVKELSRLYIAIQKTNLNTSVTIELEDKLIVTKTIAEWILRRRDLAHLDRVAWDALTMKGLRNQQMQQSSGEIKEIKIVRCYDQEEKDRKVELYTSEPKLIDAKLEVVNAVTDLME